MREREMSYSDFKAFGPRYKDGYAVDEYKA